MYHAPSKNHDNSFSATSTIESGSVGGSSISSGICLAPDDLRILLNELQPNQPLNIRREAVKNLALVSVGDLLADEFWCESKRLMECTLLDDDFDIAYSGLKIYAHAFKSAPPYLAPEIFVSYVDSLHHSFEQNALESGTSDSLDMTSAKTKLKLKQFRLLNQYMCEIPSLWFRFSEKTFKEVMFSTFRLLSIPGHDSRKLSPLHYLSVIDPNALWYNKWMISQLGRVQVISAMKRTQAISIFVNLFCKYALNDLPKFQTSQTVESSMVDRSDSDSNISHKDLEYLHFLHLTVFISKMINCKAGRACFPIKTDTSMLDIGMDLLGDRHENDHSLLSIKSFVFIMVRNLNSLASLSSDNYTDVELPSDIVSFRLPCFFGLIIKDIISNNSHSFKDIFTVCRFLT